MTLAAAPDGHLAVGVPQNGGGVGFDVTLVHRRGAEFSLHNQIGFLEPFVQVTQLEEEVVGHVSRFAVVILGP